MTDDIVAFIRARLDEDARDADDLHDIELCDQVRLDGPPCDCGIPGRMLRAIEAKRGLLALTLDGENGVACANALVEGEYDSDMEWPEKILCLLASEWSDHEDYQTVWS